jgi:putative spermidine/putrescine transport system ATP-binding protein
MILVAQGPEEALALGDRIAVLEAGRIEQVGTPAELKRRPANAVVARLLGAAAVLPGPSAEQATLSDGGLWLPAEALEVVAPGLGMPARVLGATMLGATVRLDLQLLADGRQLEAEVPSMGIGGSLPPGSIIGIRLRAGARTDGSALN